MAGGGERSLAFGFNGGVEKKNFTLAEMQRGLGGFKKTGFVFRRDQQAVLHDEKRGGVFERPTPSSEPDVAHFSISCCIVTSGYFWGCAVR